MRRRSVRAPRSRGTVSTGVAMRPSGSLAATPTRTEPTSTPSRAPRPNDARGSPGSSWGAPAPPPRRTVTSAAARTVGDAVPHGGEGVCQARHVRAATLRDVVLAAAAAAEDRGRSLGEGAGLPAAVARSGVRGHEDERTLLGHAGD